MIRRVMSVVMQASLLAGLFSLNVVRPAIAACIVDNGANNGTDSGVEFGLVGFPGSDDGPAHDQGSWAPTNNWHDSWLKEWCEPSHDWAYDNYIRWDGARWDKLQAFKSTRSIAQDINIRPPTSYNWTGQASSTLPFTAFYVADPVEQWFQGSEEISCANWRRSKIGKAVNYNTRSQWDQEGDPLDWIDSKSQWTDREFNGINFDVIGRMDDKKHKQ